jgi:hypothetical protein
MTQKVISGNLTPKKPTNYKLICELAFGCIPEDWEWAIKTSIYEKIENNHMKTILDIVTPELLGKKILSFEKTGASTYEMTLRIDKIFGYKNGHLECEVTIYAKDGGKRSGMITAFDFDNWKYILV